MKTSLNTFYYALRQLKKPWQLLLFIIFNLLLSYIIYMISLFFHSEGFYSPNREETLLKQFTIGVLLGPLLETVIFQYAIIESIRGKLRIRYVVVISALCFSLIHLYSVSYFIYALFGGLAFGLLYFLQETVFRSVLMVWMAHFLFNLIVFLVRLL